MNFRTDMAVERRDIYRKAKNKEEIPGITVKEEFYDECNVTHVKVENKEGSDAIGKEIGDYITIDLKKIKNLREDEEVFIVKKTSEYLKYLLDKNGLEKGDILVVGLGNLFSTPDSLGNKVLQNIEITRHIKMYLPDMIDQNVRVVSGITPGVLGTTGIETFEIVSSITEKIKPAAVIVIDSLCSKSIDRLNKSIQLSDTGIIPGSGVGNSRMELSKKTLKVPVIAIGVPTVVDAATIIIDAMNEFEVSFDEDDIVNKMNLNNFNFIVTPKEIDELIDSMSSIVSDVINEIV